MSGVCPYCTVQLHRTSKINTALPNSHFLPAHQRPLHLRSNFLEAPTHAPKHQGISSFDASQPLVDHGHVDRRSGHIDRGSTMVEAAMPTFVSRDLV